MTTAETAVREIWNVNNASWPHGIWKVDYNKERDRYVITTEHGAFVGEVGPTLVAYAMCKTQEQALSGVSQEAKIQKLREADRANNALLIEALKMISRSTAPRVDLHRWLREHGCNYVGLSEKPEHEILRLIAETALFHALTPSPSPEETKR